VDVHVWLWIATGLAIGLVTGWSGRRALDAAPGTGPDAARALPDLNGILAGLGELERRVIAHTVRRERTARDINAEFDQQLTFGDRLADRIASSGGSWTFICAFVAVLLGWIAYNTERPASFDPYPYILLNLVLSCLAALQAPVIMMSQNRMAAKDRLDARHDYEVNLKAEMEIMQLHGKLDELQQRAWSQLIELQERQLAALQRLERDAKTD
jgi:uncharacterized membrane protein